MKIPIIKIYHIKKVSGVFLDPVELDDFFNLRVDLSSERSKDSFSFSIINHREIINGVETFTRQSDFSKQDKINIYVYYLDEFVGYDSDGLPDSSHMLINGFISGVDYDVSESLSMFSISGVSLSENLMNILIPATYEATVPNIIIDLVGKSNATAGDDRKISASLAVLDGDGNRISGGYIWPNKSDGTAFPVKNFVKNYSNLYNHLSTLASPEYTEDNDVGTYIVYFDNNDELHFEPKKLNVSKTFDEYINPASKITKKDTKDGMVNVVLFNSGRDPYGNGILTISQNTSSIKQNGAKWKYLTEDRISTRVQTNESTLSGGIDAETGFPTSYPYTVKQSGSFLGKTYIADVTTVADNSEYKDYIRTIVGLQGKERGSTIVNELGIARPEITWEFDLGNNLYVPNDLWNITLKSVTFNDKLRVYKINHSFNSGWNTVITLKKDEKDLSYS